MVMYMMISLKKRLKAIIGKHTDTTLFLGVLGLFCIQKINYSQ